MARLDRLDDLVSEELQHGQRHDPPQYPAGYQGSDQGQDPAALFQPGHGQAVLRQPPQPRAQQRNDQQRQYQALQQYAQDSRVPQLSEGKGECTEHGGGIAACPGAVNARYLALRQDDG